MVKYYQLDILSTWANLKKQLLLFSKNNSWTKYFRLKKKQSLLILFIHNENNFNANDRKKKEYRQKIKITFIGKKKKKEIIVFEIFISIRKLLILDSMPNHQHF